MQRENQMRSACETCRRGDEAYDVWDLCFAEADNKSAYYKKGGREPIV